jgi:hypothetical protein
MDVHFETITFAPATSLTHTIDDLARQRRDAQFYPTASTVDLAEWLNALQLQEKPLVFSDAGRADLEAWLDIAQAELAKTARK